MISNIEKYSSDHIAIRQLIDLYNDVINHREWDKLPHLFAEDAVWTAGNPVNLEFKGLQHIKTEIPKSVGRTDFLLQSTSGIVIEVLGSREATGRSQLVEFGRRSEDLAGFHVVGSFLDEFKKVKGEWKFLKRKFSLIYMDSHSVLGSVYP